MREQERNAFIFVNLAQMSGQIMQKNKPYRFDAKSLGRSMRQSPNHMNLLYACLNMRPTSQWAKAKIKINLNQIMVQ